MVHLLTAKGPAEALDQQFFADPEVTKGTNGKEQIGFPQRTTYTS